MKRAGLGRREVFEVEVVMLIVWLVVGECLPRRGGGRWAVESGLCGMDWWSIW